MKFVRTILRMNAFNLTRSMSGDMAARNAKLPRRQPLHFCPTRRGIMGLLGSMACTLVVAACGENSDTFGRSYDYRYKLKVEVDTPTGVKTGFSVVEISVGKSGTIMPAAMRGGSAHLRHGEAVAIDLMPNKTLFVLLQSDLDPEWATTAAIYAVDIERPKGTDSGTDLDNYFETLRADRRVWQVKRSHGQSPSPQDPTFLSFRNLADAASVEQVDPDNLEKTFGPGVKLKSLTIQITDQPITYSITKRLPWLEQVGRSRSTLIPNPSRLLKDNSQIQLISPSDFSTELYK